METWVAEIKEKGNDHVLTPSYTFADAQIGYIKDKELRESVIRKFLVNHWGLNNPDVECFKLYKQK